VNAPAVSGAVVVVTSLVLVAAAVVDEAAGPVPSEPPESSPPQAAMTIPKTSGVISRRAFTISAPRCRCCSPVTGVARMMAARRRRV
jgi:hypothetical protein